MSRRWLLALACAVVAGGLVLLAAAPAGAHAQLISATPAPGSTVGTMPSEVRLSFDGPPYSYGLGVVVLSPSGGHLESGRVSVDGNDVVQPLRGVAPSGTITVRWRVVSADGHPASGQYTFTLAASGQSAVPGAAPDPSTSGSGRGWALLAVAALAVVVLVGMLLLPGRRRRRPAEAGTPGQ